MIPSDPTAQVAAIGILTTFITTVGVILVAVLNNRKERGDAADAGVEAALRERIALRDEQISDRDHDIADLRERLSESEKTGNFKSELIEKLHGEIAALRGGKARE